MKFATSGILINHLLLVHLDEGNAYFVLPKLASLLACTFKQYSMSSMSTVWNNTV